MTVVGRAHLLDDIIGNIETFDPNYYQKATLTYFLGENDALLVVSAKLEILDVLKKTHMMGFTNTNLLTPIMFI